MPITYYNEKEFLDMKSKLEQQVNQLCFEIKDINNEPCNKYGLAGRVCSCGSCRFSGICTSNNKYFSK